MLNVLVKLVVLDSSVLAWSVNCMFRKKINNHLPFNGVSEYTNMESRLSDIKCQLCVQLKNKQHLTNITEFKIYIILSNFSLPNRVSSPELSEILYIVFKIVSNSISKISAYICCQTEILKTVVDALSCVTGNRFSGKYKHPRNGITLK